MERAFLQLSLVFPPGLFAFPFLPSFSWSDFFCGISSFICWLWEVGLKLAAASILFFSECVYIFDIVSVLKFLDIERFFDVKFLDFCHLAKYIVHFPSVFSHLRPLFLDIWHWHDVKSMNASSFLSFENPYLQKMVAKVLEYLEAEFSRYSEFSPSWFPSLIPPWFAGFESIFLFWRLIF